MREPFPVEAIDTILGCEPEQPVGILRDASNEQIPKTLDRTQKAKPLLADGVTRMKAPVT
jgi:hypothetical protein